MAAGMARTTTVDLDDFVAYRGQLATIRWDEAPTAGGKRFAALKAAAADGEGAGPSWATNGVADSSRFGWDVIDEGPAADDVSWRAFDTAGDATEEASAQRLGGGRKLTKAQREKLRDEEQLREARESIRKRGWTENEVKWRSWLARRGHDVMVNDWNLYRHIDGECTPPSRDPFWLNANEKPLPDYEAGNEGPDEDPQPILTNIMGEEIKPKYAPPRIIELKPLWEDVDGEALRRDGLGHRAGGFYWRQTTSMVYLEVKVPEGTSARDLRVVMRPTHLTVSVGTQRPILDEELYMRIYVGSNADDNSSVWELLDKRCLVFHLVKWHRLEAGNVRDASRTWWRQCFVNEEPFEATVPPNPYYDTRKEK
jgi:hypothetical protein